MRVFELMDILNKLPAGAEVLVHGIRTVPELRSGCLVDVNEDNEDVYSVNGSVNDIDSDSEEMRVILYF